jgi:hypothetical protein
VLGGATSYLLERLGYSVNKQHGGHDDVEIVPLMGQTHDKRKSPMAVRRKTTQANDMGLGNNSNVRQRGHR